MVKNGEVPRTAGQRDADDRYFQVKEIRLRLSPPDEDNRKTQRACARLGYKFYPLPLPTELAEGFGFEE